MDILFGVVNALATVSLPLVLMQYPWLEKRRIWRQIEAQKLLRQYYKAHGAIQAAAQSLKGKVKII